MTQVSLGGLYTQSYKESGSFSFSDPGYNDGNKSLGSLVQQVLPFTSSVDPTSLNAVTTYNNGNLSGFNILNKAGDVVNAGNPKQTNISLGQISRYSSSWKPFDPTSAFNATHPQMMFKYVPNGYDVGKFSAEEIWNYQRECVVKWTDTVNYPNVNSSASDANGLGELSGSKGGFSINSGSSMTGQDFGGTLYSDGTSDSYYFVDYQLDDNSRLIPPGSGSYKIPRRESDEQVVFCFWVKIDEYPSNNTMIINTGYPNSGYGGSSNWTPYTGYAIQVTNEGRIRCIRGNGFGAGSNNRRTFQTSFSIDEGTWNFLAIRLSGKSNTVSTSTNWAWVYKSGARGFAWSNGLAYVSGTDTQGVNFGLRTQLVFNSGHQSRYYTGQIGHYYMFWEYASSSPGLMSFDKFEQIVATTNSASMYTDA